MARRHDIKAGTLELKGRSEADLAALHKYVEHEIIKARDWYFSSRKSKKYLSQFVRYAAITFSACAGIRTCHAAFVVSHVAFGFCCLAFPIAA
jgi:hypothetical protein